MTVYTQAARAKLAESVRVTPKIFMPATADCLWRKYKLSIQFMPVIVTIY